MMMMMIWTKIRITYFSVNFRCFALLRLQIFLFNLGVQFDWLLFWGALKEIFCDVKIIFVINQFQIKLTLLLRTKTKITKTNKKNKNKSKTKAKQNKTKKSFFFYRKNYPSERLDTMSTVKLGGFRSLLEASCVSHHHHHVVPLARISLTLSRHFSLSFIASVRSSGLHPVSSHSCCMYVRAGRPAFAWPYAGVHRSTSLMSSALLLQQRVWFV